MFQKVTRRKEFESQIKNNTKWQVLKRFISLQLTEIQAVNTAKCRQRRNVFREIKNKMWSLERAENKNINANILLINEVVKDES